MSHLMNEETLQPIGGVGEIVFVEMAARMEMDVPARRHDGAGELERKPAPAPDSDRRQVDGRAED